MWGSQGFVAKAYMESMDKRRVQVEGNLCEAAVTQPFMASVIYTKMQKKID